MILLILRWFTLTNSCPTPSWEILPLTLNIVVSYRVYWFGVPYWGSWKYINKQTDKWLRTRTHTHICIYINDYICTYDIFSHIRMVKPCKTSILMVKKQPVKIRWMGLGRTVNLPVNHRGKGGHLGLQLASRGFAPSQALHHTAGLGINIEKK